MVRKALGAVLAALLLAGCSSTVPGAPVADPSGVPRPDVGSFPTWPRTLAPATQKATLALEGFRMAQTIPLAPDIDPALRYGRTPGVGKLTGTIKSFYGAGVQTALWDHEVAAFTSASDRAPGAVTAGPAQSVVLGLFRFADEAAARAALRNPALLADEKDYADKPVVKVPATVPGHADAKAYTVTKKYSETLTSVTTVALLASGRFVLAGWTSGQMSQLTRFFDRQLAALKTFTPTPLDRLSTLTRDHDDLLRYTLPEASPTIFEATLPARTAAAWQSDITGAVQNFSDAGVDYVADAGNTVYRARDASGASQLRDRIIAEYTRFYAGSAESTVPRVPGSRCVSYPAYTGAKDTRTVCTATVGRYVTEVADGQQTRAEQALGASYLILKAAP